MNVLGDFIENLNNFVAQSPIGYYFHLDGSEHVRTTTP